jgi:predicted RNA-binding Zn-ribbon protein involved in translation (DUF1610 family)
MQLMHDAHVKITRFSAVVIQFPKVELIRGESAMQIDCPQCGDKAIIYSRKRLDPKVSKLYCGCKNADCAHSFAMDLSFSHSTSPSKLEKQSAALDYLRALPLSERQQLISFC